jgi:hypothetical protein
MLRYDPQWLLDYYCDETPIRPGIPYSALPFPAAVERMFTPFHRKRIITLEPHVSFDETIPRLMSAESAVLRIQPCRYSYGVRSNYAMDGPENLRDVLRGDYGPRLLPFSDTRLSTASELRSRRSRRTASHTCPAAPRERKVYPAGLHCSASGGAHLGDEDEFFESQICRELDEAGLSRADAGALRLATNRTRSKLVCTAMLI